MKRGVYIAGIVLFWLATMYWLIRYEAFPERFGQAYGGYRDFFGKGLLVMDHWMLITFKGSRIGYSHTVVDSDEANVARTIQLSNRTVLRLKIMERPQLVRVEAHAALDALHHLQTFEFILSTHGYVVELKGQRAEGNRFTVNLRTGGSEQTLAVDIPDDAMLYSPMTEMAVRQLEPGRALRVKTFNPATMTSDEVLVKALRRETLTLAAGPRDAILLSAAFHGMEVKSWIDRDGQILRQETPFGWIMETCTPAEALKVDLASEPAADLLSTLAVPSTRPIAQPREARRLRLRLHGPALDGMVLATRRQTIDRRAPDAIDLTLTADTLPDMAAASQPADPALQTYLAPSPFLQADDPAIRKQARALTAGADHPVRAAQAIFDWVYRNVRKAPTVSLPSAADVLRQMEGDCNEHTYLFVALARAAGIPAKVMVGLVYHEGSFYYHAWPAVFLGRWTEMDPTLGEPGVDATHIALLEGELADQMKLMGVLGRLQIEVLPPEPAKESQP
jgi:hypothetical protein